MQTNETAARLAEAVDLEACPGTAILTRAEVAKISGFSVVTLKLWAKQGRGPKITRIENRPRFRVADVREWLAGKAA